MIATWLIHVTPFDIHMLHYYYISITLSIDSYTRILHWHSMVSTLFLECQPCCILLSSHFMPAQFSLHYGWQPGTAIILTSCLGLWLTVWCDGHADGHDGADGYDNIGMKRFGPTARPSWVSEPVLLCKGLTNKCKTRCNNRRNKLGQHLQFCNDK